MGKKYDVFVGTVTEPANYGMGYPDAEKGLGIYHFELDGETGDISVCGVTTGVRNPTHLARSRTGRYLYAANELKECEGQQSGAVSAFRIEPGKSVLTPVNHRLTGGTDPCYLTLNDQNTHLLVTNFTSGSVVTFPIGPDGALGEPSQFLQHEGSSVNPVRQSNAHPHSCQLDRNNTHVIIPDLGMDQLVVYQTDFIAGRLIPAETPFLAVRPGDAPRHGAFHPSGRFYYVTQELSAAVSVYSYGEQNGTLTEIQTVPTSIADPSGVNTSADIHVRPDGGFLYASNRGHGSIAIYKIDGENGRLSFVGLEAAGGRKPRGFGIDPDGKFLLVGNQDANTLLVFRIHRESGMLEKLCQVKVPMISSVKIYNKYEDS